MMDIKLNDGTTVENCVKVKVRGDIITCKRLFYELGQRKGLEWIRMNVFKEVVEVAKFLESEPLLDDDSFIEHHNFYIVPGESEGLYDHLKDQPVKMYPVPELTPVQNSANTWFTLVLLPILTTRGVRLDDELRNAWDILINVNLKPKE